MAFEPNVAPFITGSIQTPQILDPGLNPVSIIRRSDSWQIRLQWNTNGLFIPLVNPAAAWKISAYLESFGTQPDVDLRPEEETFGPPANAHSYDKTLTFAGTAALAGAYRLVVVITLTSGGMQMPVAAFTEGPMLTFFDAS